MPKKILPRNRAAPPKLTKPPQLPKATEVDSTNQDESIKTASGLTPEAEDQFEIELCWCIQQLELTVNEISSQAQQQKDAANSKEKQIMAMQRSLRSLKSNNASLIKKRQIMRNLFGDYRAKMAEDEKKLAKEVSQVSVTHKDKYDNMNKGVFVRKVHRQAKKINLETTESNEDKKSVEKKALIVPNSSDKPFLFNFQIDTAETS
ncbi:hypothetical protein TKK_0019503 [Trichogramma kaykai]|uniref:Uncharacterized protein n=1 Tax=Trichogramma kaykai TaxID=54128 RepID=A0ABD2VS99_9HYME